MAHIDPTSAEELLRDCRDLLEHDLADLNDELGPVIADEVQKLVESTRDEVRKADYLRLLSDLQQRWECYTSACGDELASLLQRGKSGEPGPTATSDELQLVSDKELAEQIVLREFIGRVAESCSEEIFALDRRIAYLSGHDETDSVDNPFAPELVCTAVRAGCVAMYPDVSQYSLLLRQLERHLRSELPALYRAINEVLIDADILPNLKRSYRPSNAGATSKHTEPENVMNAMQRLVKRRGGLEGGGGTGGSSDGNGGGGGGGEFSVAINPALFDSLKALESVPADVAGALTNIVHLARNSDAARSVPPLEAITLDIVATLFDLLFNDEKVPNSIKGLVSRLQIPILKVAMLDQQFFADRAHPARRFLDSISGITMRWGKTVDEGDPFYLKLAQLVDQIHSTFDKDAGVFGVAINELAEFVTRHEALEAEASNSVAEIVLRKSEEQQAQQQRFQSARALADESLQPLLATAPPTISQFLQTLWRDVLAKLSLTGGVDGQGYQVARRIAEELIWSVTPKKTADDRKRQTALLPKLLSGLNQGLDQIEADPAARGQFMESLMALQITALHGDRASDRKHPAPATEPAAPAQPALELKVDHSIENGVRIEQVSLTAGNATVDRSTLDRASLRRVKHIARGDWVDFSDADGEIRRERLTWISPNRSLYLFSNHSAKCAISITPEALAHRLQAGTAALVAVDTPMFERALDGAIKALETQN